MILHRNELNKLIQYYNFLVNNYDNFNQIFLISDKYNKTLIKNNLFNLVEFRNAIINKDFDLAEQLYSNITLFGDQKNIIKEVFSFYKNHLDLNYDVNSGLDTFQDLQSTHEEINLKDQYNKISSLLENKTNEIIDTVNKFSIDYDEINERLQLKISEKYLDDVLKPFERKFNSTTDDFSNEVKKLQHALSQTATSYSHHEEVSKNILDNTVKNITSIQNKIHDDIHNVVAKANLTELSSFFSEIKKEVKIIQSESEKQKDKLAKNNFRWMIGSMIVFLIGITLTSFIMSNRTIKLLLDMSHNERVVQSRTK